MSKALRDTDYLDHIRDAIARIQRYTAGKLEADFLGNELIQDGVIRNLEIIGEAVTKLSPELKARYGNVPWGENPECETGSSTAICRSTWKLSGALFRKFYRYFSATLRTSSAN